MKWIVAPVGVVALLLVGLLATRDSARNTMASSPLLGRPAPEVTGKGLDGRVVRLSQHRGRYVVLNFFATWCVPCEREHPELMRFADAHREAGDATILSVIFDDDPDSVRKFFETRGGTWPVIEDPRGKVSLDFGVRGPPESFVIDPNGIVISRIVGEVSADRLERLLDEAEESAA